MSDIEYRIYDPKEDFIFKMIFGSEENKSILISLLNSILKERPYIKDVKLENNEISKIFKDSKSSRLDILAVDDNGIKYDIEMQCRKTKDIPNRAVYYASKLFTKDLKENDDYNKSRVISIWIFAENISDRKSSISEIFPSFKGNEEDNWQVFTENQRIIILELNKYQTTNENFKDLLTNWVNFIQKPEYLENNPLKIKNKELDKAIEKLEYMSKKDEERHIVDSLKDYERDYYNDTKTAKEEGLKEGKEEGLKEGLDKGLKEGLDKGLKEGEKNKSIEIAKNMLKKGYKIEDISELSGLSLDEIEELK